MNMMMHHCENSQNTKCQQCTMLVRNRIFMPQGGNIEQCNASGKRVCQFLKNRNIHFPHDPVITLQYINARVMETHIHTVTLHEWSQKLYL